MIHAAEHALQHVLAESFGHALGHGLAHAGGAALHGVVAGGLAAHKTVKNRRKEKLFAKTGGLSGFSRTKANKEVTKAWSGAAVGTSGSVAGALAGGAVGTVMCCLQFSIEDSLYLNSNVLILSLNYPLDDSTRRWNRSWRSNRWRYWKRNWWHNWTKSVWENI